MSNNKLNTKKTCSRCGGIKDLSDFYKSKTHSSGFYSDCKKCNNLVGKKYKRTRNGLVSGMYSHQVRLSKVRKHNPPNYTVSELRVWVFSQSNFEQLYIDWIKSDCKRMLVPSCDRLKDSLPYSFDNLRLVTWRDNSHKQFQDMRDGTLKNKGFFGGGLKAVIGTNVNTGETIEFISMTQAEKSGFSHSCISECCSGKQKIHKSHTWKLKTIQPCLDYYKTVKLNETI